MAELECPHLECIEDSPSHARFIMAPLNPGYGIIIGNSMRRILLSSMPGTAVTSIQISGIQHEFSTISGIKEDVTEITLNVKGIIAKLECEGSKTAYIEAVGPCIVSAGDIKDDTDIEILNPDLHIATLGENAFLSMELTISHGRGYIPAENNKPDRIVIGTIPVDSNYNPVQKVNYTIDKLHDGAHDHLTLEVWTNGVLTARDAAALSGLILRDHFAMMSGAKEYLFTASEKKKAESFDILDTPIEDMDLSVRAHNCLKRAGIDTIRTLTSKTEYDLFRIKSMGQKSLDEIIGKVTSMGLSLAIDEDRPIKYERRGGF